MSTRHPPGRRADYRWFRELTTRWMDNDVFCHVNNVIYFSWFDTAVTYWESTHNVVDLLNGPIHCVVAEIQCRYYSSVAWPDRISVGLRVARIGNSSVRYEIGVFRDNDDIAAAEGYFAHVFVERGSQKPASIRDAFRRILKTISTEELHGPRYQRP